MAHVDFDESTDVMQAEMLQSLAQRTRDDPGATRDEAAEEATTGKWCAYYAEVSIETRDPSPGHVEETALLPLKKRAHTQAPSAPAPDRRRSHWVSFFALMLFAVVAAGSLCWSELASAEQQAVLRRVLRILEKGRRTLHILADSTNVDWRSL
jgi:hypothetical protein